MPRDNSFIIPGTGNKITEAKSVVQVLKYHHLGLAVEDVEASTAFFAKLGFTPSTANAPTILRNSSGMELHLLQADEAPTNEIGDKLNLLQDCPATKFCGHTHAAFAVPSVMAARSFLEAQGMTITGERTLGGAVKSVFVRDLDRTTWEFERNVGDSTVGDFDASMIGDEHRRIDHVGTRVSNAPQSWQWYATMFGFTEEVLYYEHNPQEPLKNFRPWISRTQETGIDINLLINSNEPPTDDKKNILMTDGILKPGILYVGLEVSNVQASQQALKEAGASVFSEDDVVTLGLKKDKLPTLERPSIFVADPDWNLYRLVQQ